MALSCTNLRSVPRKKFPVVKTPLLLLLGWLLVGPALAQEKLTNENIIALVQARMAKSLVLDKIKASLPQFDMRTPAVIQLRTAKVPDAIVDAMMIASAPMPPMRNQDVMDLYAAGVSRDIILKKIQYSETRFDLSTNALLELKAAKIPDPLLKVMMVPSRAKEEQVQKTEVNVVAAPLPPHPELPPPPRDRFAEPGIYYEEFRPRPSYEQLEPTTTNNTKSGSFGESVASSYTGGITGTTQRVGLANKTANMVVEDNRPVFFFVFSGARKDLNQVAESVFDGVASPNDFVLMRAKTTSRGRDVTIGRSSAYTSETGFSAGAVPFRFKKITPQLYRVWFERDVPAGEYVFVYNKGSEATSSLKMYDFSLRNNTR
jgi:hypothetical protein